jgi:hypothetical protein
VASASAVTGLEEEEEADGIWSLDFCTILLAKLDEPDCIIRE